ncbi:iron ABC transporter permease [Antarctobacter sp.]|uniref:FecCD family ABC transporter permease n=1 Tax=Antarctobacter sp. TaxID=1872577 RepID=UPI002B272D55|nr:iron ABC transporter permease [Antarctobacter sp.]
MSVTTDDLDLPRDRQSRARNLHWQLAGVLVLCALLSLQVGAADVTLTALIGKLLSGTELGQIERVILFDIRLPRLTMGILVGAALAVSGATMQGLFRNPLADPGIVGVGAGAGLGAVLAIVLGAFLPVWVQDLTGNQLTPFAAFLGGWGTTLVLYRVSTRHGRTSVATMLLAGIALGALAGALSGILVYIADDRQLRDLTFWGMGSLAGASFAKVLSVGPLIVVSIGVALALGRGLNGLALGEATAAHIGINVQRMKNIAILAVAGAAGAAVAVSGGIGFIGIVVPHLLRLWSGPDHRTLLLNSALLGASLLVLADVIARVVIAPAELPIGIVTAVLGAPVFLWILLKRRGLVGL